MINFDLVTVPNILIIGIFTIIWLILIQWISKQTGSSVSGE